MTRVLQFVKMAAEGASLDGQDSAFIHCVTLVSEYGPTHQDLAKAK